MTTFSAVKAATEGLRVIRREPTAVMGWIGIWALALVVVGTLQVITMPGASGAGAYPGASATLVSRFGPLWPVLVLTILVLWIMTTASLFRAVLRPDEHGWHLFKLGADELRLGAITAAATVAVLVFGSGPAFILWLLAKPMLAAIPMAGRFVVVLGTLGTVCLEIWIGVRLSLAPVHTFAEGRFHLVGYWRLTHGRFWRLLGSYSLLGLQILVLFMLVAVAVLIIGAVASGLAAGHMSLLDRAVVFGFVGVTAVLLAVVFVVPLTLVCACQALVYAAIVTPDPGAPWGRSRIGGWALRHARTPAKKV